ncbi:MAG TPA: hypothetical protein VFN74_04550, partial [Chloroflexota bacterium]|nr:hypothetical protein [Chloroflexota bacterium]
MTSSTASFALRLLSALLVFAIWLFAASARSAAAQGTPGSPFRAMVLVSERGFDPPVIDVPQGLPVELTFVYGDGHLPDDNPHFMRIEALGLESAEISRSNPKTSVTFTASESAEIKYVCAIRCVGHGRLRDGKLNVVPVASIAAAPYRAGVMVSEKGFDPPVIDVPRGLPVELTFLYGDAHLPDDNPHFMRLEGLGIDSPEISRDNPKTSVTFTASESGSIKYVCAIRCVGHGRLRDGAINVVEPAVLFGAARPAVAVAAPAAAPTALPPTAVPATAVPTAVPATAVPPTAVPPTPAPTAVASSAAPPTVSRAQATGGPFRASIVVSERGFDPPVLDVPEGQQIELTFVYGDGHLPDDNPHVMRIEGLNIESGEIGRSTPQTTVTFTASQSGEIKYVCAIRCVGHGRLRDGKLNVVPASAVSVVAQKVNLSLAGTSPEAVGANARLRAQLATMAGAPVEGVTVHFEQRTNLVAPGWVHLGAAVTDKGGVASFDYLPFGEPGEQAVRAIFEGGSRYEPATTASNLSVSQMLPAWHAPV